MRGGGGVDHQGTHVAHVGEVGVQLQGIDELPCQLAGGIAVGIVDLQVEREHGTGVIQAQLLLDGVPRGRLKSRVVHGADLVIGSQELSDCAGVLIVLVHAEGQGVQTLRDDPCVEGG